MIGVLGRASGKWAPLKRSVPWTAHRIFGRWVFPMNANIKCMFKTSCCNNTNVPQSAYKRKSQPWFYHTFTITHTLASSDTEQHILYQIYCSLTVCWHGCCHCFRSHSAWSSLTTIARYATVSILAIKARLTQSTAQQSLLLQSLSSSSQLYFSSNNLSPIAFG